MEECIFGLPVGLAIFASVLALCWAVEKLTGRTGDDICDSEPKDGVAQ